MWRLKGLCEPICTTTACSSQKLFSLLQQIGLKSVLGPSPSDQLLHQGLHSSGALCFYDGLKRQHAIQCG